MGYNLFYGYDIDFSQVFANTNLFIKFPSLIPSTSLGGENVYYTTPASDYLGS